MTVIAYGTVGGTTQRVAEILHSLGDKVTKCAPVDETDLSTLEADEGVIIGAPTLNTNAEEDRSGTAIDDWLYTVLPDLNFEGRKVAIFGLGAAKGYSYYFCDAAGEIYDRVTEAGAKVYGTGVSIEDYEFDESRAVREHLGGFVGMMFDEEQESDLSEERASKWIAQLRSEGFPI